MRDQMIIGWAHLSRNQNDISVMASWNVENVGIDSDGKIFVTPRIGNGEMIVSQSDNEYYVSVVGKV